MYGGTWHRKLTSYGSHVCLSLPVDLALGLKHFYFWGGAGGSSDINTLFSYIAKETIDPHYALGVFPQPIWGRAHIN